MWWSTCWWTSATPFSIRIRYERETEQPDVLIDAAASADAAARKRSVWARLLKNTSVVVDGVVLIVMVLVAWRRRSAPVIRRVRSRQPIKSPAPRPSRGRRGTSWVFKMGTDTSPRTYSRVVLAQVSLAVGFTVAIFNILIGTAVGLMAGYIRWLDGLVMRVMDGMMAIPGILLHRPGVAVERRVGHGNFSDHHSRSPRVVPFGRLSCRSARNLCRGGDLGPRRPS